MYEISILLNKVMHLIFHQILSFQAKKDKSGKPPSLWKVYIEVYGWRMLWAGLFKLVADLLNFVGPLCVGGITLYVTGIKYNDPDDPDKKPVVSTFITFIVSVNSLKKC